jgi:hypothetical protein
MSLSDREIEGDRSEASFANGERRALSERGEGFQLSLRGVVAGTASGARAFGELQRKRSPHG